MMSAVLARSFHTSQKPASTSASPSIPSTRLPAPNAETVSTRHCGRTRPSSRTTPATTRSTPPISVGARLVAMTTVSERVTRAVAVSVVASV